VGFWANDGYRKLEMDEHKDFFTIFYVEIRSFNFFKSCFSSSTD